jgi:hypothetical protein
VLEEPLPEGDYAEILKNGVILCRLINKINPTSIVKFKEKVQSKPKIQQATLESKPVANHS